MTVRVVVVEDSDVQRAHLVRVLEADGDIEVVGQAADTAAALDVVRNRRPDVVTVDLQLPGGGGQQVIERIMGFMPTPIVVISAHLGGPESEAAVEALVAGALDAVPKPSRWTASAEAELRKRVRELRGATVLRHPRGRRATAKEASADGPRTVPVVAVAASTGGPPAVAKLLSAMAGLRAAVLVVQHLHPDFIDGFVSWMARESPMPVQLAANGAVLQQGAVYIAPGGLHLRVGRDGRVALGPEPRTIHRPSADELFTSVAKHVGDRSVGVLLTGMGDDGAKGLLAMRSAGALTIAQDEQSSAVFGMPRAAVALDAATQVLGLDDIARAVVRATRGLS